MAKSYLTCNDHGKNRNSIAFLVCLIVAVKLETPLFGTLVFINLLKLLN